MNRRFATLAVIATLLATLAEPAAAWYEAERPWMRQRLPGGAEPDEPLLPPSGWRWGAAMTFPYTAAAGLAYLGEGAPTAYKLGATWGIHDGRDTIATQLSDYRLYGALMYYLVPGAPGGPYVETGLNVVKASGPILPLNWPIVPHIGFGTTGRWNPTTAWDLSFTATANGVLSLEAGLIL